VTPVRSFHIGPPSIMIVECDFAIGRRENDSACYKIFSRRSWKFFLRGGAFSDRDVTSRLNKLLELPIRHWSRIHPEAIYANAMNRPGIIRRHRHFVAAFAVYNGAHREFATRNPDHAFWCGTGHGRFVLNRLGEFGRGRWFRMTDCDPDTEAGYNESTHIRRGQQQQRCGNSTYYD